MNFLFDISQFDFVVKIKEFFEANLIARIIIDAYIALLLVSFVVFLCIKHRKAFILVVIGLIIFIISIAAKEFGLKISEQVYTPFAASYIVLVAVILAPDIRKFLDYNKSQETVKSNILSATQSTKEAIVDAVFNMSGQKVGALITLEFHSSLEQFAERAISLNSDVSRELLEQIFIKDSPLHDGGVIIRGNKIVCAAAYYVLSQDSTIDKTMGSRHRAALGISEITDSLTIIVSEETGDVHCATGGFMKIMDNKNELLDYLNFYLGD